MGQGQPILVTGGRGLLGSALTEAAEARGQPVQALGKDEWDVTAPGVARSILAELQPRSIVHCAAFTAVDAAETDEDEAMRVNRDGTRLVAEAAAEVGAAFVYFSTDYAFDGTAARPYRASDPTAPLGAYGRSKVAGEEAALRAHPSPLIIRTGWLYGGHGSSFLSKILALAAAGNDLKVVADQRGRPTWTRNLAAATLDLVGAGATGVIHVADSGEATWFDLAQEALRLRGYNVALEAVSSEEWNAPARRPFYSVLDLEHAEEILGRPMMDWHEALHLYLTEGD